MNPVRSDEGQREGAAASRLRSAIVASLVVNVLFGVGAFALPGQDDVPGGAKVGAVVLAVIAVVGAAGLWQHRRWGSWTTVGVTVVNVLSGLGALLDPPSAAIAVLVVMSIPIGIAVVVLLRRPEVRTLLH